jgi:hypothetical protein
MKDKSYSINGSPYAFFGQIDYVQNIFAQIFSSVYAQFKVFGQKIINDA